MTILALRAIRKSFGATIALDGVDLELERGEVHALIGENGAGKSTLLNIISGLLKPDSGEVHRAGRIAHIHQELMIFPHLSVEENILIGTKGVSAAPLLAEFAREDIDLRARAGSLSLADRQVIEICRALAINADVILMDEPTSSLQRSDVDRLFTVIHRLKQRGIAIVYVSHFLEEVREIADRYTVLRDGRSVISGVLSDVRDEELIRAMVGREVTGFRGSEVRTNPETSQPRNPILQVRSLASPPRLRSATFDLRGSEILGLAGLIGSGRTDLVRALFGLQKISGGEIVTDATFGYLSEDRKGEGLALPLSIADNVTISRLRSIAPHGWIDRNAQDEKTSAIMQRLRIKAPHPRTVVARLSGGNQQKVAIGRLLHQDPGILLLDEPARGVDIGSKSDIYDEIVRLARGGKAILMVSSYLPELFAVCDRIAVMTRGRLSEARPTSEWTPDSIMEAAISAA
ncbi:MAG TPA: sugar ABC transporter ATP-binding protein [Thermoanaerobaculia bacterium]|jgi:ribose transport system ATP-binding protein|nr:sugar ABC transporter ATP-binding protein [Thermoanaerobaculia bacterium]